MTRSSEQKVKMGALAKRLREELEGWHREHELDLAEMIQEKPELFRALLAKPSLFQGSPLGERYCRLVSSAVSKAEKSAIYREAFISPREGIHPKDNLSIGRMVPTRKLAKYRRGKD